MADHHGATGDSELSDVLARRRIGPAIEHGGGGGGPTDRMEHRIASLEKSYEKLDGKIDKLTDLVRAFGEKSAERLATIEGRLNGIEKALDAKASTADVKELSGKVSNIPTTWQTVAIIAALLAGIGGVSFTISKLGDGTRQTVPAASQQNPAGRP